MAKSPRKAINLKTQLASALLQIPRLDAFGRPILGPDGRLTYCVSFEEAKAMTVQAIRSRFDLDHTILHCWGGGTHPSNLTWRLREDHREKTKSDIRVAARVRRAEKKRDQMKVTNDLPTINTILDKLPKHAPDRRKAVIPGSKRSPYRKKVNGTVERRP